MKNMMKLVLVAISPLVLATPLMGQVKAVPELEKKVEVKKPTLTFYFFDQ